MIKPTEFIHPEDAVALRKQDNMANHPLIIYPRPGYEIDESTLPTNIRLVNTPLLEVSSTFIRESLKQGKDVRYFLHPKVWERVTSSTIE